MNSVTHISRQGSEEPSSVLSRQREPHKNDPGLLSVTTAVPSCVLHQCDVRDRARVLFRDRADIDRLLPIFDNTGIDQRYSCVPIDWYSEPHDWVDRTALYVDHAVRLLEEVALACIREAGLSRVDIDAIVVVSTTGIATPSLDAVLVERLGLRRDISRLPIFGLGCAGGVIGLMRAAEIARARPGSKILFLVVELCTLTFRKDDLSKSNIVGAALFGDGVAGLILSAEAPNVLRAAGEYTWPNSLDIMGWEVERDGLKALFSQNIPALVASDFRAILLDFLRRNDLNLADMSRFACHPGGAKVLNALEAALSLPEGGLAESRSVLREFGNMSAATVLFVLERMKHELAKGKTLVTSLGPGFSSAFLVIEPR